jgi:hypothetical protein
VRLASPIGSAAGGSVNLSTSLSNVAKVAAHPKFVWVFNANCDRAIIYNDPVQGYIFIMCRNFTYEVVGQRRRIKAIKKIVQGERNSMSQLYQKKRKDDRKNLKRGS